VIVHRFPRSAKRDPLRAIRQTLSAKRYPLFAVHYQFVVFGCDDCKDRLKADR